MIGRYHDSPETGSFYYASEAWSIGRGNEESSWRTCCAALHRCCSPWEMKKKEKSNWRRVDPSGEIFFVSTPPIWTVLNPRGHHLVQLRAPRTD